MEIKLPLPKPMTARQARRWKAKMERNPEYRKRKQKAEDAAFHRAEKRRKQVALQQHEAHKRALLRGSKLALKKHGGTSKLVDHPKSCLA